MTAKSGRSPAVPWVAAASAPGASIVGETGFGRAGYLFLVPLLFFLYSRILDITIPGLHLPMVFSLITLAAVMAEGAWLEVSGYPATRCLFVFTLWFCVTIVTSVWRGGSFDVLKDFWIKSFLIYLVVASLITTLERMRSVLRAIAFGIMCSGLIALLKGSVDRSGRLQLPFGELSNANAFGLIMVLGIIFCWYSITYAGAPKRWRVLGIVMLLPLSYAMLRSGSRSAMLTLVIALLYAFLRLPAQKKLMLVIIAVVGAPLLIALLPGHITERLATTFTRQDELTRESSGLEHSAVASTESRWYLFKQSVYVTLHHPVFGVGAGNFTVAENEIATQEGRRGNWHVPHNGYTQISSEMGIVGLALYVGAIVSCWRKLKRIKTHDLPEAYALEIQHTVFSLQLSMVAMLVAAVFGLNLYSYYLPAFLGLIVGLDRCMQKMQRGVGEKVNPQPGWTGARLGGTVGNGSLVPASTTTLSPVRGAARGARYQQPWQRRAH